MLGLDKPEYKKGLSEKVNPFFFLIIRVEALTNFTLSSQYLPYLSNKNAF